MAGYTLTPPGSTTGPVGVASGNWTVHLTATISGSVVVTPHDGASGTFSPTSVSVTNASPDATFTYTPSAAGTVTMTTTNDRALADPTDGWTYTGTAAGRRRCQSCFL